ncbi:hypothetical protein Dimus_028950 [Dionaea muscipula]
MAKEVVKALEDKEVADKEKIAKPQTYRRRKKASKSEPKRKLIVSESEEENVDAAIIPQDDVVLPTSRDIDGESIMEIVLYHAPTFASNQKSVPTSSHGATPAYVDIEAQLSSSTSGGTLHSGSSRSFVSGRRSSLDLSGRHSSGGSWPAAIDDADLDLCRFAVIGAARVEAWVDGRAAVWVEAWVDGQRSATACSSLVEILALAAEWPGAEASLL